MKIETLNELFSAKNPSGWARLGKKSGTIEVLFSTNGKVYTYRSTVYRLAERFELIPDVDIVAEAKRIARELEHSESVVGYAGCGDTLRHTYNPNVVEEFNAGTDEFDRKLSSYRIEENNSWI